MGYLAYPCWIKGGWLAGWLSYDWLVFMLSFGDGGRVVEAELGVTG